MEDLEAYQDKFSESGKRILESALNEARKRQQHFILPEHLLYALIIEESELFELKIKQFSLSPKDVRSAVEKRLENSRQHIGHGFRIAPETTEIFKFSMDRARSQGRRVIEPEDIISVFLTVKKDVLDDILQNSENPTVFYERNRINLNFLQNPQPPKSQAQIEFEAKQMEVWQRFHEEQRRFLSNISWEDVVKNNKLLSGLTRLGGGGGSGGGIGSGGSQISDNEIRYSQHSSLGFSYKVENEANFNPDEIIASLKNDVEVCLKQHELKITKSESFSSSFIFEYKGKNLTGKIKIFGELTNYYYSISINQNETCVRKK
ncbi:MAG TPA: Clp protease N-terminal domain-containing protein [Pyrinomonadaceae bacterium]|nr:Clp protease N-terminal domain-containing protein [Pyrinomonadaceae bacterium]